MVLAEDEFDELDNLYDDVDDEHISHDDHHAQEGNITQAAVKAALDIPDALLYSPEHFWVDSSHDPAVVGVSAFGSNQLGELTYVDLPSVGQEVSAGEEIGELESQKAVETIISPVSGTIVYVHDEVSDDPQLINDDPYGEGWLVKIVVDDEIDDLLGAEEYKALTSRL